MKKTVSLSEQFKEGLLFIQKMSSRNQELLAEFGKFDHLLHPRMGIIKRYATQKLAQQLGGVQCQEPRQETDWFTAENFLNNFTDDQWFFIARRDLILRAYEILRRSKGLSGISSSVTHLFDEGISGFIKIMETLLILPEDELLNLLTEASNSEDDMDKYLGRLIWEMGYQRIKHNLPSPPYGCIIFH